MKRIVLVLLWVFVVVNCFGQNNEYRVKVEQDNRYHFQPSNVEYDPTSWIEAVSDNMERAKAGHQQGQNLPARCKAQSGSRVSVPGVSAV